MSVPPSLPSQTVSSGPQLGLYLLKDATLGALLIITLFTVTRCSTPQVKESVDHSITSDTATPSPKAATSAAPAASMTPEVLAANPPAEESPEGVSTATVSSQNKPALAATPIPSAFATAYISAPLPETVSTPEDKAQVEKVRQDLLVAAAPTMPVERAKRAPVITEQKVEFFSVKSKAQTVAFVVDCSSSMSGAAFDMCRLELLRAIIDLQPDQAFYVLFFSSGPVPLPGQSDSKPTWSTARSWVKHQTGVRLAQMHASGGTNPEQSLNIAASLNPDVIYLLTDGGFSPLSSRTMADFKQRNIHVNTIGFMDQSGAQLLKQIASDTNGTYQFIANLPDSRLAGKLQAQMAALLLADARSADASELNSIHGALVDFARHDHGPLRIADINRSLVPWRKWYLDIITQQWAALPSQELAAHFAKGTRDEKIAILKVIRKTLSEQLLSECIGGLSEMDDEVRQAARDALKDVSGGYDWGPKPDTGDPAAMAAEVASWERWQRMRSMVNVLSRGKADNLKAAASDASVDRRWAAAIAMGLEQKAPVEWLLIPLTDADMLVRDAAVKSLQAKSRQLKHSELGPELKNQPGRYLIDEILDLLKNSDPQIAASAEQALIALASPNDSFAANITGETGPVLGTDWPAWWIKRKDQPARKDLEFAKKLLELKNPATQEKNREAATKRFRDIIKHYPGTPSAATAERLLPKE